MVEGKATFEGAGRDWGVLGERMNVFEKTPPHCLYLPMAATGRRRPRPIASLRCVRRRAARSPGAAHRA